MGEDATHLSSAECPIYAFLIHICVPFIWALDFLPHWERERAREGEREEERERERERV